MDYPKSSWIYTSDQLYSRPPQDCLRRCHSSYPKYIFGGRQRKHSVDIECFHKTDHFDKKFHNIGPSDDPWGHPRLTAFHSHVA